MTRFSWYRLAVCAMAVPRLATSAGAQTISAVSDGPRGIPSIHRSVPGIDIATREGIRRYLGDEEVSPAGSEGPAAAMRRGTRGRNALIGAAVGGVIGVAIGEFWFGQRLDFPHGPAMLLGAGILAGVGAALAFALTAKDSGSTATPKKTIAIAPVLSPTRKAVMVRLALR